MRWGRESQRQGPREVRERPQLPGGRYRFIYEHPVEPPSPDAADPVLEFTQRCTDVLEMYVRRHPELWLWMHRSWREREPGLAASEPSLDEEVNG